MQKIKYYKNPDFTVRQIIEEGVSERYFITFHGQVEDSPEIKLDLEMFLFYAKESHQILERDRDEKRRHLADCDDFELSGGPALKQKSFCATTSRSFCGLVHPSSKDDSVCTWKNTLSLVLQGLRGVQREPFGNL